MSNDYLTMTRDLTSEMSEKVWAARVGMTAEEHLREAATLLAGDFGPYGSRLCWVPSTPERAARAAAHAALAQAMAAAEVRQATIEAPEIRPAVPR